MTALAAEELSGEGLDLELKREGKSYTLDTLREIKKLRQYMRDGTPQPLAVGGYGYGKYRWSIVSYDAEIRRTTRDGEVLEAAVSLTLQEYLKHELQSKRKLRRLVKAPV